MRCPRNNMAGAYPRERGGTSERCSSVFQVQGLSPRARGNRQAGDPGTPPGGPIPASAGEPQTAEDGIAPGTAYPRERGGTETLITADRALEGLSPRARGNQDRQPPADAASGPIPASAGEPIKTKAARPTDGAYPRERGGTRTTIAPGCFAVGLSPRARGNRGCLGRGRTGRGPIPASAGEPVIHALEDDLDGAYPRERGGTTVVSLSFDSPPGLSPRARGNLALEGDHRPQDGPIPASAGEPENSRRRRWSRRAYPRERGGTTLTHSRAAGVGGLSPRARGNRCDPSQVHSPSGPIPASAGEPEILGISRLTNRAYPRERGGTGPSVRGRHRARGLSPRARGNPSSSLVTVSAVGPIPASAGEPCRLVLAATMRGAYPRERGGTGQRHASPIRQQGLSPRARGNLHFAISFRDNLGPIPASAGEPSHQNHRP